MAHVRRYAFSRFGSCPDISCNVSSDEMSTPCFLEKITSLPSVDFVHRGLNIKNVYEKKKKNANIFLSLRRTVFVSNFQKQYFYWQIITTDIQITLCVTTKKNKKKTKEEHKHTSLLFQTDFPPTDVVII